MSKKFQSAEAALPIEFLINREIKFINPVY